MVDSTKAPVLTPEEEILISDFSLSFIQAILKSSYYAPSHPGSKKAKEGLYKKLKDILSENREITYFRKSLPSGEEVLFIEYSPHEAFPLNKILKSDMGRLFIPKYIAYFERKKLALITIKSKIAEMEFHHFIEVMAENIEGSEHMTSKSFEEYFAQRGIEHITLVFEDEVVGARRKLPWKVELALSRLRKDLKMIPLFKDKTDEEIRNMKKMVLADIIRPFREAHLASRLLANIDLAYHGIEKYVGEELEKEIVNLLGSEIIPELTLELSELLQKTLDIKDSEEAEAVRKNLKKSIGFSVERLIKEHPSRFDVFEKILKDKIISEKDLPEEARKYISGKKLAIERLKNWGDFLKKVKESSIDEFVKLGEEILLMSDTLEEESAFEEIASLSGALKEKAEAERDNPAFAHIANNVLKAFAQRGGVLKSISSVISQYEEGLLDREKVKEVINGFSALGELSLPYLLEILEKSSSKTVRWMIINVLSERGGEYAGLILRALKMPGKPWYFKRNLILILGKLKAEIARDTIKIYLRDPEPRVREEALSALENMGDRDLHIYVGNFLKDPSPHLRSRAMLALKSVKVVTPELYISAIENLKDPAISITSKEIALKTFEKWGNKKFPDQRTVEELLLEIFEEKEGFLKRFESSEESDKLKYLILQTLQKIGGKKTILFLQKNLKKLSPFLQELAKKIISEKTKSP